MHAYMEKISIVIICQSMVQLKASRSPKSKTICDTHPSMILRPRFSLILKSSNEHSLLKKGVCLPINSVVQGDIWCLFDHCHQAGQCVESLYPSWSVSSQHIKSASDHLEAQPSYGSGQPLIGHVQTPPVQAASIGGQQQSDHAANVSSRQI